MAFLVAGVLGMLVLCERTPSLWLLITVSSVLSQSVAKSLIHPFDDIY